MSEFKLELVELINKYYLDYEYIEIKVHRPMANLATKIDVRVME